MLEDSRYGLQTMSDTYIFDEFMMEQEGGAKNHSQMHLYSHL